MNKDQEIDGSPEPDDTLFLWACGFSLAVGGVGILLGSIVGFDARAYLPKPEEMNPWQIAIDFGIGTLAAVPMVIAVMLIMLIPHSAVDGIKKFGESPLIKSMLSLTRLELILISLCAGVGEEVAFRGCLLPWITALHGEDGQPLNQFEVGDPLLSAHPGMLAVGVVVSSLAFGLLHPVSRLYIGIAALMGAYFSALMIATDSLLVPIVAHAAYDAVQMLLGKRSIDADDG